MYKINEIFFSLQGEGPSIGYPAVFIRFSGCNLECSFCDTRHEEGETIHRPEMIVSRAVEAIQDAVRFNDSQWRHANIRAVFTGGEPLLQLNVPLVKAFRDEGFIACVETNGSVIPDNEAALGALELADEVIVSPKTLDTDGDVLERATCLKILCPLMFEEKTILTWSQRICKSRFQIPSYVIQPLTPHKNEGGAMGMVWTDNCYEAVKISQRWLKEFLTTWRVIPQTHVAMGIR